MPQICSSFSWSTSLLGISFFNRLTSSRPDSGWADKVLLRVEGPSVCAGVFWCADVGLGLGFEVDACTLYLRLLDPVVGSSVCWLLYFCNYSARLFCIPALFSTRAPLCFPAFSHCSTYKNVSHISKATRIGGMYLEAGVRRDKKVTHNPFWAGAVISLYLFFISAAFFWRRNKKVIGAQNFKVQIYETTIRPTKSTAVVSNVLRFALN